MKATAEEVDKIMSLPVCRVDEVAKVLGIGRMQAYAMVNRGDIRSRHVGRRVLVPTAAIRDYLEGHTNAA